MQAIFDRVSENVFSKNKKRLFKKRSGCLQFAKKEKKERERKLVDYVEVFSNNRKRYLFKMPRDSVFGEPGNERKDKWF